jgi:hypothetical protein
MITVIDKNQDQIVSKPAHEISSGKMFTGKIRNHTWSGLFMAYPTGLILFQNGYSGPSFLGLRDLIVDNYKEVDVEIKY